MIAGATPMRTSVKAKVTDRCTTTRSHDAIRPSPPARTAPPTAATVGLFGVHQTLEDAHHRCRVGRAAGAFLQIGAGAERRAVVRQHDDTNARGRLDLVESLAELGHELARQRVAVVLGVERDRRDPGVDVESDDLIRNDLLGAGIHRDATVVVVRRSAVDGLRNEQPEELFGLGTVPGAPHRRERTHDLPSVAGGGESGIEHGDDTTIARGADEAAARLRQEHCRRGRSI